MEVGIAIPATAEALESLLEGLVLTNRELLRRSQLPPLYASGVRYKRERPGRERWQTCEQTYARGFGDCEDLASWRAAELRRAGEIGATCVVRKTGPRLWHVLVGRENGMIEDPSRILGMGE